MSLIYVATIIPLSVCVSVDLSKCAACTAYDVPCFFLGNAVNSWHLRVKQSIWPKITFIWQQILPWALGVCEILTILTMSYSLTTPCVLVACIPLHSALEVFWVLIPNNDPKSNTQLICPHIRAWGQSATSTEILPKRTFVCHWFMNWTDKFVTVTKNLWDEHLNHFKCPFAN